MSSAKSAALLATITVMLAGGVTFASTGDALAGSCFTVGYTTFCDARSAGKTVGSSLIFHQGRPGRRVGRFIIVEENGLPRTRGEIGREAGDDRRRETRSPGTVAPLIDRSDFGAYVVPSRPRFAPLQRSGPN